MRKHIIGYCRIHMTRWVGRCRECAYPISYKYFTTAEPVLIPEVAKPATYLEF